MTVHEIDPRRRGERSERLEGLYGALQELTGIAHALEDLSQEKDRRHVLHALAKFQRLQIAEVYRQITYVRAVSDDLPF